ncbi:MAG: excinuclease ABC subunit UvrA [Acidobacteria bacterium]|nr:excinuclease ABC subunit UvrA [Acidobacteriota bacterium]
MDSIVIRGARQHNLRNVSLTIPRNALVVLTGVSGSGKSSLAFDTLFAEGQRRYVESLSAYARQFLEQMEKPDVDSIEGLSPAISIEQKTTSKNPRSTVGTVTEIYDYLRLLFASVGKPHCTSCGRPIAAQTIQQMTDKVLAMPEGRRFLVLSPYVRGKKGEYKKQMGEMQKAGFQRARVNGAMVDLADPPELDKQKKHTIEIVVDRLVVKHGDDEMRRRLADSLETAAKTSKGLVTISVLGANPDDPPAEETLSTSYSCPDCGTSLAEVTPRLFSFNSPFGACGGCSGLGTVKKVDVESLVPDEQKSIADGAIALFKEGSTSWRLKQIEQLAKALKFSMATPWRELPRSVRDVILFGSGGSEIKWKYKSEKGQYQWSSAFKGIVPTLQAKYKEVAGDDAREEIERFMIASPCPDCGGRRLKKDALSVLLDGRAIDSLTDMTLDDAQAFFHGLNLSPREREIAGKILKEIEDRLGFLTHVGIGYLSLSRASASLSGGESQRIRLATQIGSKLMGVLYVLDEPSIGLHPRDNAKLIETLVAMRDLGNTVVVVEHDEETIRAADRVVDLGPGAGVHGGEIVGEGHADELVKFPRSLTGKYLSGELRIDVPKERRKGNGRFVSVVNATANNLKGVTARFPLGAFTAVTGVSGSGKSTLVNDILYAAAARVLYGASERPGAHRKLEGLEHLDKVIDIDQSPIGRTPRSNPATYTNLFGPIRELMAQVPEARVRGYGPGRFSFNVKGGRCENCGGGGQIAIEMHFLPDIYVTCDVCGGKRYNRETLEIRYKGHSIADILDMTAEQAAEVFANVPTIRQVSETLVDVGLGYVRLGQPATTLSGGEAQRVKLAKELARRATGRTLYILDEPTTGLHFDDVRKLLMVLHALVERGNTVIVIEHNLDVVKTADYLLDLGPEGGAGGGLIIAQGTPEEVSRNPASATGRFLTPLLGAVAPPVPGSAPAMAPVGPARRKSRAQGG